jgi:hypothetical protein
MFKNFYSIFVSDKKIFIKEAFMAHEIVDGKVTGSSGVAKAGLTLGIIGSALGLMNNSGCGNGILGGIFSNKNNSCDSSAEIARLSAGQYTDRVGAEVFSASVRNAGKITDLVSEISKLKSEKYTDGVGIELYKNIVAFSNAEDAKIRDLQAQLSAFAIDIDKKVALNEQAAMLNRQYDALARDAGFKLLEQKIDCCCDKANMKIDWNAEKACMTDASLLSYVNSTFLPGTLKLPATSICPQPTTTTA